MLVKAERKNLLSKLLEALILTNLEWTSDSVESKPVKASRGVRSRPRRAGGDGKHEPPMRQIHSGGSRRRSYDQYRWSWENNRRAQVARSYNEWVRQSQEANHAGI